MSDRDEHGRWQPGHTPTSKGRPPNSYSLTAILRTHGEDLVTGPRGEVTNAERLGELMWQWALDGDKQVAVHIFDRLDGKAKERIQVSGGDPEENPVYVMLRKLTEGSKEKDAK